MNPESQTELVRSLPLGPAPEVTRAVHVKRRGLATEPANPDGLIVGGNMLAFAENMPPSARQAVSLNLLFAQEAAKGDPIAASPDLWVTRHDMVFQNPLGWFVTGGASQFTRYDNGGLEVHQAILPLLTAALGPAAGAAALIVTGVTQLQKTDEDQPWITLFDREARRFEHSEYRFAVAEAVGETVSLGSSRSVSPRPPSASKCSSSRPRTSTSSSPSPPGHWASISPAWNNSGPRSKPDSTTAPPV